MGLTEEEEEASYSSIMKTTTTRPLLAIIRYYSSHARPPKPNYSSILKAKGGGGGSMNIQSSSTSPHKALLLLRRLQRDATSSIDSFTLLSVLKACIKTPSPLLHGEQIHGFVINLGFDSIIFLQTALISVYSSAGNLEGAHRVFDGMSRRNVICWTALISAYVDNRKPGKALHLFRRMQEENVQPDRVTITTALSACADLGALDMGEWIHAYVCRKKGFKIDLCLKNALINMYAKCGDIKTSRQLFDRTSQRDLTTWTSMIVGHAVHGQAEEALRLFAEMKHNHGDDGAITPNEVTFIGVLMACSHAGRVEQGLHHLESMSKDYNLKPQMSHYGCMVDLFCRAGLLKEAYSFIRKMPITPKAVVWRTLLGACSLHGNVELGAHIRSQLFKLEPNYVGDVVTISNVYAAAGMWEEKTMVRKQIKQQRAPGCSLIEVESRVHEFVAADRNHPQTREIYDVLEGLAKNLRASAYCSRRF